MMDLMNHRATAMVQEEPPPTHPGTLEPSPSTAFDVSNHPHLAPPAHIGADTKVDASKVDVSKVDVSKVDAGNPQKAAPPGRYLSPPHHLRASHSPTRRDEPLASPAPSSARLTSGQIAPPTRPSSPPVSTLAMSTLATSTLEQPRQLLEQPRSEAHAGSPLQHLQWREAGPPNHALSLSPSAHPAGSHPAAPHSPGQDLTTGQNSNFDQSALHHAAEASPPPRPKRKQLTRVSGFHLDAKARIWP